VEYLEAKVERLEEELAYQDTHGRTQIEAVEQDYEKMQARLSGRIRELEVRLEAAEREQEPPPLGSNRRPYVTLLVYGLVMGEGIEEEEGGFEGVSLECRAKTMDVPPPLVHL
jgi:uncharacterized coiled-coil protein SlyX